MFISKEIDTINNVDVFDMFKDLYLSEKEVTSKHTDDQWLGNIGECKKRKWFSSGSKNPGKCDKKGVWQKVWGCYQILTS